VSVRALVFTTHYIIIGPGRRGNRRALYSVMMITLLSDDDVRLRNERVRRVRRKPFWTPSGSRKKPIAGDWYQTI